MQGRAERPRIDQIEKVIVVGSGKGGVGKSTVSVNLAVALAKRGARVGLLDGDAYGPSVPMMLGVRKRGASQGWSATLPLGQRGSLPPEQMLKPLVRYGVEVMSVGFFIGEEQLVAPMPDVLGVLIRQLLYTIYWGPLDYLIIDLPPGNGEPQATLCRELHLDGAILVTTPQDIARIDTAKGLGMFQSAGVPVLGLVQNMSGFVCPHCGEHIDIFPTSLEYRALLDELPLLGAIPLDPATAVSGDTGQPVVVRMPESAVAQAFGCIAEKIAGMVEMGQPETNMRTPEKEDESGKTDEKRLDREEGSRRNEYP
ncbi:MAG TPA: P-loop NTPase [Ktedonobacteraceae bacterium]|nr:P-loop NTPase [Ktedonobacteraceae bacterium]